MDGEDEAVIFAEGVGVVRPEDKSNLENTVLIQSVF